MKRFEKILLRTSAYTVLIFTAFCLFSGALAMQTPAIEIKKFFSILLFSGICATAENLTDTKRLNALFRTLIRYGASLGAFCFLLMPMASSVSGTADVFVAIAVFTLAFAVTIGIIFAVRVGIDSLFGKAKKNETPKKAPEKPKYTPRYKD